VKNKSHFKIQNTVKATRIHPNRLNTNAEHGMQLQPVGIWSTCQFRICTLVYLYMYIYVINDQLTACEVQ